VGERGLPAPAQAMLWINSPLSPTPPPQGGRGNTDGIHLLAQRRGESGFVTRARALLATHLG
jgi:hypothetical protein